MSNHRCAKTKQDELTVQSLQCMSEACWSSVANRAKILQNKLPMYHTGSYWLLCPTSSGRYATLSCCYLPSVKRD